MTRPVSERASYRDQESRMTWLAGKVMRNELQRLHTRKHGKSKPRRFGK